MLRPAHALAVVAALAPLAPAQSFNVDVGSNGPPSSAFGAAAGQTGVWNVVTASTTLDLVDVGGNATPVDLSVNGEIVLGTSSEPLADSEEAKLVGDHTWHGPVTKTWRFAGLEPGFYSVYVYMRATGGGSCGVIVSAPTSYQSSVCIPFVHTFSGTFGHGTIYARFELHLGAGQEVQVVQDDQDIYAFTNTHGFQIVKHEEPGVPFCFGDGTARSCPCSNPGATGTGCKNSRGVGAVLESGGTSSVSAGDLRFTARQVVAGQTALLFAGSGAFGDLDGVPFGDGKRCVVQSLVRLGARAVDAQGTAAWGPGLAPPGGWSPGEYRYFHAWYRDPVLGPCGANFNTTQALAVRFDP